MTNEAAMMEALAELESQEEPNYSAVAKKFKLGRTTIMRRYKGQTRPRVQFLSESIQCLTKEQEETLIMHINRMTDRNMPPTSQIVRNLAEEIIGKPVGKNWTGQFVRRYQSRLKSIYLSNIEHLRVKGEYGPYYQHFYDLVWSNLPYSLLVIPTLKTPTNRPYFPIVQRCSPTVSPYCRKHL
jgi:hypothetical protein